MEIRWNNSNYNFSADASIMRPWDIKAYVGATYSKALIERFINAEDSQEFIDDIEKNVPSVIKKINLVINKKSEATFKEMDGLFCEILKMWEDPELNLFEMDLINVEGKMKVLLKMIRDFIEENDAILNPKEEQENDIIYDFLIQNEDNLLAVMAVLYILSHYDKLEISDNRINVLNSVFYYYISNSLFAFDSITKIRELTDKANASEALEKELDNKNKIVEAKKKDYLKLVAENEASKKKIKELSKVLDANQAEKFESDNKLLREQVKQLEGTLISIKSDTVTKKDYDRLNKDYKELSDKYSERGLEISRLKSKLSDLEGRTLTEDLEAYLKRNGLTEELILMIHPYYQDYMEGKRPIKINQNDKSNRILGYCKVKSTGHYFVSIEGQESQLYNIPDASYIGENQFILVDKDINFIHAYDYFYEPCSYDHEIRNFQELRHCNDEWGVINCEEEFMPIKNRNNFSFYDRQIVGLNAENEVIHIYKRIKFNADCFLKSAVVRNQSVYLVQKVIKSGFLVVNLATNEEQFINIDYTGDLEASSIIFVKNDAIIKVLDNTRFYTSSTAYKGSELGYVEIRNSKVYFNKKNEERVLVRLIPDEILLEAGDLITIDEYNNFIDKKRVRLTDEISEESRILNFRLNIPDHNKKEDVTLPELSDEKILIIGDAKLETAYKLAFLKEGFEVAVVDGVEAWHKIAKSARMSDYIIYVTEHGSHANYYKFKSEFADKTILYTNYGGANRVVELFKKYYEECQSAEQEVAMTLT